MKSKTNCLFSIGRKSVLLLPALFPVALRSQNAMPPAAANSFLYLKVQLDPNLKPASLKPGDVVEGELVRSVYWRYQEVLPKGGRVRLLVDRIERRKRVMNDHWPWAIKAFAPRHEKYPTFRTAQVWLAGGRSLNLQISLLSITQNVAVRAEWGKKRPHCDPTEPNAPEVGLTLISNPGTIASKAKTPPARFTASLQAFVNPADLPADPGNQASLPYAEKMAISAGTQAKVVLLDGVSASGSHPKDAFQALLIEPISVGSTVLVPAGSVLEGKVAKAQKPRIMSRSGSLLLSFTFIINPDGTANRVDASVSGVTLDRHSHARIEAEGEIRGDRPGAAWLLMNLGVTGGLAKVADDGTQLMVQAIVSTATDASTAGTSRIIAACVSGVFMLTRHGRDVVLPKFTEMEITFNRPVVLSAVSLNAAPRSDEPPAQSRMEQ